MGLAEKLSDDEAMAIWQEALSRGIRFGRAAALIKQLQARFGREVTAGHWAALFISNERSLACWSLRVLTAPTLDAVFRSRRSRKPAKKPPAPKRRATPRKRARTAG